MSKGKRTGLVQLLGPSSGHRRAGFRRKLCGVFRSEKVR